MKKLTVADWMEMKNMAYDERAKNYKLGQKLTAEQAREIKDIVAHSTNCPLDSVGVRDDWRTLGSNYRRFMFSFAILLMSHHSRWSNWSNALWDVLEDEDRIIANELSDNYLFDYFFKK